MHTSPSSQCKQPTERFFREPRNPRDLVKRTVSMSSMEHDVNTLWCGKAPRVYYPQDFRVCVQWDFFVLRFQDDSS